MRTRNRGFGLVATVGMMTALFVGAAPAAHADGFAPSIVSASSAAFTVDSSDTFLVETTGDPTPTLSESGALPSGVSFDDNGDGTASLNGIADFGSAGSYPLTITASNGVAPDATQDFLLIVNPLLNAFFSGSGATFIEGSASGFTVQAIGDPTPGLSESGALPSGVTFNDNGNGTATLAGIPAGGTNGSYPLTITASNGVNPDVTQDFLLTVILLPPPLPGGCSGIQFLATIVPPLLGNGDPTSTVAALKTAKAGLVVWGPGFGAQLTTTGVGSCTFGFTSSFNDVTVGAKLSGTASCDPARTDSTLYPLNGKLKLSYASKTLSTQAYVRIAGYDPVPGPDIVALTGMVIKGPGLGATIGGEVFFDPVVKALSDNEAGGPELKGQYYFDNSQIIGPCGSSPLAGGVGLVYGGDGTSLLGSTATGLTLTFN